MSSLMKSVATQENPIFDLDAAKGESDIDSSSRAAPAGNDDDSI